MRPVPRDPLDTASLDVAALPVTLAEHVRAGVFAVRRDDALTAGIDANLLKRWCRSGYLTALGQGLYVINVAPRPGLPVQERRRFAHVHLAQALAIGLADAYLVGRTAACAHGLSRLGVPRDVEIARPGSGRSRRDHVHVRPAWGIGAVVGGVQPIAECLIEMAAADGCAATRAVAAAAIAEGRVTAAELTVALARFEGRPGVVAARQLVTSLRTEQTRPQAA